MRVAACAMRSVLVDHARAHLADKRGGAAQSEAINVDALSIGGQSEMFLALDDALARLSKADAALARVAELRLFSGLEHGEIATALGVSLSTVERAWRLARSWLQRELGHEPG
jgi:RNA polymerase sigma factor (TIGR02999 family)